MSGTNIKRAKRSSADQNDVNVIVRALDILDLFERAPRMLPMMSVVQETGLHKATAFRLLTTLVHEQLLRQTEAGEYELGPYALRRASVVKSCDPLWLTVRRAMEALRDEVNESVVFTRRFGNDCVDIDFVQASTAVMQAPCIGHRVSLHENVGGCSILALERPEARAHYMNHVELSGTKRSAVLEAIDGGRLAIAAGIRDTSGALVAALWLSIAPGRVIARGELMDVLKRACSELAISICE
jgi:DNA-binding IclR family transcriptional regulator